MKNKRRRQQKVVEPERKKEKKKGRRKEEEEEIRNAIKTQSKKERPSETNKQIKTYRN